MKTTPKWSKALLAGMAAMVLAFGLVVMGCDDGNNDNNNDPNGGGNTDPKTLVITEAGNYLGYTGSLGIFPVGTSPEQALARTGLVAGRENQSISSTTVSVPLYLPSPNDTTRWTGSGTYDIYLVVGGSAFYKASGVAITSAATTIIGSSLVQVYLGGGGVSNLPSAPDLVAASVSSGVIRLTWSWNYGEGITSQKIYRSTSGPAGTYSLLATITSTDLPYYYDTVGAGVVRSYKMSAVNSYGEGPQSLIATAQANY